MRTHWTMEGIVGDVMNEKIKTFYAVNKNSQCVVTHKQYYNNSCFLCFCLYGYSMDYFNTRGEETYLQGMP